MRALGICGPGAATLADRLVKRLDGSVGVVRAGETDGGAVAEPAERGERTDYTLSDAGWSASGTGMTPDEAIDRLAPDHDYALLVDFPDARVPQVALGGADTGGEVVLEAGDGDSTDVAAVVEAIERVEPHETLESLVAEVKRSPLADRSGAIATFTGRVRAKDDEDDSRTQYLEFEKYEGVADERMRRIETELEERDGVFEVAMYHRTGVVPDGEDIVFVVVLAGHREEAFRTVEDGINRLKDEVPLFKKEVTTDETFWVHERD